MTIEEDLFARLSADADVSALVGARIYPIRAPQAAALPRIVFQRQEAENLGTLAGRGTHDRVQVQVECFAETVEQARALATAATLALDAWRGTGAVNWCRVIGRQQGIEASPQADPGVKRDALLLLILAAET